MRQPRTRISTASASIDRNFARPPAVGNPLAHRRLTPVHLLVAAALAFAPGCPRGILPIQPNSIGPAAAAALAREDPKSRPLVVGATIATADQGRGGIARRQCGAAVWQRTVVVYIRLRAFG